MLTKDDDDGPEMLQSTRELDRERYFVGLQNSERFERNVAGGLRKGNKPEFQVGIVQHEPNDEGGQCSGGQPSRALRAPDW